MSGAELVQTLREQGFSLAVLPEGRLSVRPADRLTDALREQIRQCKGDVLAALSAPLTPTIFWTDSRHIDPSNPPAPYVNARGELIIPFESAPRYRWWDGGQSIWATLLELGAPLDVLVRYVESDTLKTRQ